MTPFRVLCKPDYMRCKHGFVLEITQSGNFAETDTLISTLRELIRSEFSQEHFDDVTAARINRRLIDELRFKERGRFLQGTFVLDLDTEWSWSIPIPDEEFCRSWFPPERRASARS